MAASSISAHHSLPLARIFLVGVAVPALIAGLDHVLLSRLGANSHGGLFTVLVLAVYVAQVGLIGVLCGQLEMPVLRWVIFVWCWILLDLQLISAAVLVQQGRSGYGGDPSRILLTSLFAAQLGLVTVWAVLGTTWWVIRLPAALVVAALVSGPLLGQRFRRGDLTEMFFAQTAALLLICGILRWQRFRLRAEGVGPSPGGKGELGQLQFGVRHVLIWTTSLAVALGVARGLGLLSPGLFRDLLGSQWLSLTSAGIVVAMVLVVALWAALGGGPAWLRWSLLAVVAGVAGCGLSFLFAIADLASGFRGAFWPAFFQNWWGLFGRNWWLIAWVALAGGLLFAALLIFRTLGYRLTRSPRQTTRA